MTPSSALRSSAARGAAHLGHHRYAQGRPADPSDSLEPAAALFSKIPLKAGETTMIAAPMFHSWRVCPLQPPAAAGLDARAAQKVRARGDAQGGRQHRQARSARRPVMLQRILDLGEAQIARYDLHALARDRLSGSVLPVTLATGRMDAFGDVLYNLYGSTEVAWATIATPQDMRAAPAPPGARRWARSSSCSTRTATRSARRARQDLRRQHDDVRGLPPTAAARRWSRA